MLVPVFFGDVERGLRESEARAVDQHQREVRLPLMSRDDFLLDRANVVDLAHVGA